MIRQDLCGSFVRFSFSTLVSPPFLIPGLHGEAKALASLHCQSCSSHVGSVPRAGPSFQEGLLLWKPGLPWD